MHHIHAPVSGALLDRLIALAGQHGDAVRAILGRLSPDDARVVADALAALINEPLVRVADERLVLKDDAWPPREGGDPQLAEFISLLEELDSRGLRPDLARRVQARVIVNSQGLATGHVDLDLATILPGDPDIAWYWDLELAYGGRRAWANEWVPHAPRGVLWVATSAHGGEGALDWHEIGRMDEELPVIRASRITAGRLRVGWTEGAWGQGTVTGIGLEYPGRFDADIAGALDEILIALAPTVGRLTLMPSA